MLIKRAIAASVLLLVMAGGMLFAQTGTGIYGVVKSQGTGGLYDKPVEGVVVKALDANGQTIAQTVSSESGAYRLAVAAGHYRLTAEHPDYLGFDTRDVILEVADSQFTLFNIGLAPNRQASVGTLLGKVASIDNSPVPQATITVRTDVGAAVSTANTGETGEFYFELPAGNYSLEVTHPAYERLGPLNVEVGADTPVELNLTMQQGPVSTGGIQGLIRARANGGTAGRPIPGAVVTATDPLSSRSDTATSNEIGYYKLTLPPGQYVIRAEHPDFMAMDSGEEPLTVNADRVETWNALLLPKASAEGVSQRRERFPVAIGSSYGERHIIYLRVAATGILTVSYRWSGSAGGLALIVTGPDGIPRRVDGRSPLSITTEVKQDIIALGSQWEIAIANFDGGSAEGTLTVNYPIQQ